VVLRHQASQKLIIKRDMRRMSEKLKKEILADPFYEKCCITGSYGVSWEHCWLYAGKQINEKWAIVPLRGDLNTSHPPKEVKEKCQLISLSRATKEDLAKYPKKNWEQIKKHLTSKYGEVKHKAFEC
jgi:hypothetical protein